MQQYISVENEKSVIIKGAKKVLSSIPTQAVIQTETGIIIFSGNEIEVKKLDIENTEVCLYGLFSNIKFSKKTEKQPLLKRIFK